MTAKNLTGKTPKQVVMDAKSQERLKAIQEDICADSESATVRFCISEIHRLRFANSKASGF
jgi:hypothetical protein